MTPRMEKRGSSPVRYRGDDQRLTTRCRNRFEVMSCNHQGNVGSSSLEWEKKSPATDLTASSIESCKLEEIENPQKRYCRIMSIWGVKFRWWNCEELVRLKMCKAGIVMVVQRFLGRRNVETRGWGCSAAVFDQGAPTSN